LRNRGPGTSRGKVRFPVARLDGFRPEADIPAALPCAEVLPSGDVKTIGRELNVRYVLEGSVQRGGSRMRVNVQLIDAESGNHLWAERFDKPLADLFDMQDEIVARLANTLDAQLTSAEARRADQAPNCDSRDPYFQGLAWLNKAATPDDVAQARGFFDRALAADPDNVDARGLDRCRHLAAEVLDSSDR
jgi:hypothetical protein